MAVIERHEPNTFCWPELSSTDVAAAKAFYAGLFGWTLGDSPVAGGGTYTLCSLGGKNVAGLFAMRAEEKQQGVPTHWSSYVSVTSVELMADRAAFAGAKIVAPPFDVMDVGRMAVIQDPAGAMFSLWQPRIHIGAQRMREPGAPSWFELMTTDIEAARRFYADVFGWRAATDAGTGYTEFFLRDTPGGKAGRAIAGMLARPAGMASIPPSWLVYFDVADVDAAAIVATKLGGRTVVPPRDIPRVGRFAVLMDSTGGGFAVLRLSARAAEAGKPGAAAAPSAVPSVAAKPPGARGKRPAAATKRKPARAHKPAKKRAVRKARPRGKARAKAKARPKAKPRRARKRR